MNNLVLKIRLGFAGALLVLIIISALSIGSISVLNDNAEDEAHTHLVLTKLEEVVSVLKDAESGSRGYILSGKEYHLKLYTTAIKSMDRELSELKDIIADNKSQLRNFDLLKMQTRKRIAVLDSILFFYKNKDAVKVQHMISEGHGFILMERVKAIVAQMKYEESNLLLQRQRSTRLSSGITYGIIVVGNLLALAIVAGALYFIDKDMVKRVESEHEIRERQIKLENLNKELEAFSYTISHDLRSPLRAIDGFGKILAEDYENVLNPEGKRVLNIIRNNALKMGRLIDDLLEFSRLNRKGLNKESFEMKEMIEEVIGEIKTQYPHDNRHIEIKPMVNCLADGPLMRQVWTNLISNAFKYTSHTSPAFIEIGCIQKEYQIEYYIRDNGAGFDMLYKDKLFGIFQRLHSNKEFEGTGVGLAIVKRIIERHGGRIDAEAVVNQGAWFYFTLPIA